MLDQAIDALNRGDVAGAHGLANEVLSVEAGNLEAGDLLAAKAAPEGELRRLTVMFCDLVGSTELSERLEPEAYHSLLIRYQDLCREVVEGRYEGWVVAFRGDGVLAAFGFPVAHENDVDRAVLAGLDLVAAIERLGEDLAREGHDRLLVRVAVHKGLVYLDRSTKDLYGLAVNVAARLEGLAAIGTLLVSDEVAQLVGGRFDLEAHPAREVKGVAAPLVTHTVLGPRAGGSPAPRAFVGRTEELGALRAAWGRSLSGERSTGDCVAIVGEAGIGKTRLVDALAHEARVEGATVLTLPGSPLHTGVGLWPYRAFIEGQLGFTRQTDGATRVERLRALVTERGLDESVVPLLAATLDLDPETSGYAPEELGDRQLRERVGEAVLAVVRSSVTEPGTVVLAEDLHWFDDESRDLVAQLVRTDDSRLLVVVTSRNPADAPRGARTVALHLQPLEPDERVALVTAIGGEQLEPAAQREVLDRCDGVPLYLEELVRTALRRPQGGAAPVASRDAPASVPDVLYEPLVARLEGAAHGASVAAAVATIGREADRGLLAQVSELPPDDLEEAIVGLLGALVLERAGTIPERFRFRHELVREVAYDLQPPSRRRDLHARVADALVADAADTDAVDWAVVATHYETAGRVAAAADALDNAARAARRRGALPEARELLGRAIELVAGATEAMVEREIDLRLQRGFIAVSLEGNSSAVAAADYERCLELALPLGDSDAMFATLLVIWSYYSARAEFDRADELLDVLPRIGGPRRDAAHLFAIGGRALTAIYRGDFTRALPLAEEALYLSSSLEGVSAYEQWWYIPIDPVASYVSMPAICRVPMGDPSRLEQAFAAARQATAPLPFPQGPFTHAGWLSFDVWMHLEVGDIDAAQASHEEMLEVAARYGFDQWTMVAATQAEVIRAYRHLPGATEEDRAVLAGCAGTIGIYLNMWKMVDTYVAITYYLTLQGRFLAAAGDRDGARACLEESLSIAARTGQRLYDVEALRHLANLQDDPAGRAHGLRTAIELAHAQGAYMYGVRAAVDLHDATGELEPLTALLALIPESSSYPELDAARALVR
jgi:class 3 adenylate cyclase/tetratricopeptide (TPR) repeat protein